MTDGTTDQSGSMRQHGAIMRASSTHVVVWVESLGVVCDGVILSLVQQLRLRAAGGVATHALVDPWLEFHDGYMAGRGHEFRRPTRRAKILGRLPDECWPSLAA